MSASKNLRILREMRNLPQKYVAHKLNMSQSNYSRIENGRVRISADDLMKISNILQVKASIIFELSEQQIFNLITQPQKEINSLHEM